MAAGGGMFCGVVGKFEQVKSGVTLRVSTRLTTAGSRARNSFALRGEMPAIQSPVAAADGVRQTVIVR